MPSTFAGDGFQAASVEHANSAQILQKAHQAAELFKSTKALRLQQVRARWRDGTERPLPGLDNFEKALRTAVKHGEFDVASNINKLLKQLWPEHKTSLFSKESDEGGSGGNDGLGASAIFRNTSDGDVCEEDSLNSVARLDPLTPFIRAKRPEAVIATPSAAVKLAEILPAGAAFNDVVVDPDESDAPIEVNLDELAESLIRNVPHEEALFLEEILEYCPKGTGIHNLLRAMSRRADAFGENRAQTLYVVGRRVRYQAFLPVSTPVVA
eukprot:TRINITY_DN62123_c0_g1_i1.p1 TRINITY_DN62123_c0_g1~~TRINITY_DN62123_c0_g1_i1.p1  ORF type:complete len:297 (+),score=71.33 TRINITY_DN62123_c0_g1_i1:90-893(+)